MPEQKERLPYRKVRTCVQLWLLEENNNGWQCLKTSVTGGRGCADWACYTHIWISFLVATNGLNWTDVWIVSGWRIFIPEHSFCWQINTMPCQCWIFGEFESIFEPDTTVKKFCLFFQFFFMQDIIPFPLSIFLLTHPFNICIVIHQQYTTG